MAHDGFARAIAPAHTMNDGDTIFAIGTGDFTGETNVTTIGALGADVALALTGVAGPSEQDGMPVGTLCVGLALGESVQARTFRMPGQRDQMRQMSVITALDLLRRTLLDS